MTNKQQKVIRASKGAYLTNTLKAPSGVTRMAGANAYAVKFAISPTATGKEKNSKNKRK